MTEPGPLLLTERLALRPLGAVDLDDMLAVYGDADAMRWVGDGRPITGDACREWIDKTAANFAARGYGMCALVDRDTGAVAGFAGLVHPGGQEQVEIKYALRRARWGQGLATEAVAALLAHGRERFGLRRVEATTAPENAASHRVLEKVGMERGELRADEDGLPTQVFVWTGG